MGRGHIPLPKNPTPSQPYGPRGFDPKFCPSGLALVSPQILNQSLPVIRVLSCRAMNDQALQAVYLAKKSPKIAIWTPSHNFVGLYLRN